VNELLRRVFNLPPQASSVAAGIDALHFVIILSTLAGATAIALTLALAPRRRAPKSAEKAPSRRSVMRFEVFGIGGLLAAFLAVWVIGYRQYETLITPPPDALDVYVVAKQWMWSFAYPDGTATTVDLYVPTGRPVRLLMTSRDVIHSFFVPAFRIKHDVVPGRMTVVWFEAVERGTYPVLCAEYCGLSHSLMRARVHALSPADYEHWQRQQQTHSPLQANGEWHDAPGELSSMTGLAAYGARVAAERGCLRCHTLDGTAHIGPSWAGDYGSRVLLSDGQQIVVDDAYLTESMMDPNARVRQSFQPVMPSYFGVLSAPETAALVELFHALRNQTAAREEPLAQPAPEQEPPGTRSELLPRAGERSAVAGRAAEPATQERRR
jgi:cytochrome c oxidase subunit 2